MNHHNHNWSEGSNVDSSHSCGHGSASGDDQDPASLNGNTNSRVNHCSPAPNFTEEEVFVGDLSYFCTEQDLHQFFAPIGDVVEVRIRWSHEIRSLGHSLMHGFVKFRTAAEANTAVQRYDNTMFMGRYMRIQPCVGYNNQDGKGRRSRNNNLLGGVHLHISFISSENITTIVNEEYVRRIYSRYGEIGDVTITRHNIEQDPPKQSGYGFVFMMHAHQAEAALPVLRQFDHDNIRFDSVYSTKDRKKQGGGRGQGGSRSNGSGSYPNNGGDQQQSPRNQSKMHKNVVQPPFPGHTIPVYPPISNGSVVVVSTTTPMPLNIPSPGQSGQSYQNPHVSKQYNGNVQSAYYQPPPSAPSSWEYRQPYHVSAQGIPPVVYYAHVPPQIITPQQQLSQPAQQYSYVQQRANSNHTHTSITPQQPPSLQSTPNPSADGNQPIPGQQSSSLRSVQSPPNETILAQQQQPSQQMTMFPPMVMMPTQIPFMPPTSAQTQLQRTNLCSSYSQPSTQLQQHNSPHQPSQHQFYQHTTQRYNQSGRR